MSTKLHGPAVEFVAHAAASKGWALDIGCAYGFFTLAAINSGARVVANDLDRTHLRILRQQVPAELSLNLRTRLGAFPDVSLPAAAITSILASNVINFMDGETLERAVAAMHRLLTPGGKVFLKTPSPYSKHINQSAVEEYERRQAANEKWPGLFHDMHKRRVEGLRDIYGDMMHFHNPDTLSRTFASAGFTVEQAEFYSIPPSPNDDKELVRLVACKK
jgi:SAM-dependent methyltransferase